MILPLGNAVEEALGYAAGQGAIDAEQILAGLPHPSGANGHRFKQFDDRKRALKRQIDRAFQNHSVRGRAIS